MQLFVRIQTADPNTPKISTINVETDHTHRSSDGKTLADYNITDGSTLDRVIRIIAEDLTIKIAEIDQVDNVARLTVKFTFPSSAVVEFSSTLEEGTWISVTDPIYLSDTEQKISVPSALSATGRQFFRLATSGPPPQ